MEKELIFEIITYELRKHFANVSCINRDYDNNAATYCFSKVCNLDLQNAIHITQDDLQFTSLKSIYAFDIDQQSYVKNKTLYFYSENSYNYKLPSKFEIDIKYKHYSHLLKVSLNKYLNADIN